MLFHSAILLKRMAPNAFWEIACALARIKAGMAQAPHCCPRRTGWPLRGGYFRTGGFNEAFDARTSNTLWRRDSTLVGVDFYLAMDSFSCEMNQPHSVACIASLPRKWGEWSHLVGSSSPHSRGRLAGTRLAGGTLTRRFATVHVVRMRFRRRNSAALARPDEQWIGLAMANIEDGGRDIAARPAGTAVAPPRAGRAATKEPVEPA